MPAPTVSSSASRRPGRSQPDHAVGEGALAGQNDAVGGANLSRFAGYDDLGGNRRTLRRQLHGAGGRGEVAAPVIDDGDLHGRSAAAKAGSRATSRPKATSVLRAATTWL